jgi:surfeit locus 1 family protein
MRVPPRLLLLTAFGFAALVFARLGVWQVHRLRERRAANARALAERSEPPVTITDAHQAGVSLTGRRAAARGRYDEDHDIIIRGRVYQGVPGVEIVSPLLLETSGTAILVNRGFVPTPDAFTIRLDSLRERGIVRVEGLALPLASGRGAPLRHKGETTWARLDYDAISGQLPYPIAHVYLQQLPDSALPSFPRRLDPPALDDGPHLNYAIQWFSFSAMALVFGIVIARQRPRASLQLIDGNAKR